MPARNLLIATIILLITSPAIACLWDYDTLRDEKRGMPGIAEVLAGQWERHSKFFYENRVAKMKSLLAVHPENQDAIDNLGVAYFKLGDSDSAIAVMLDKEKRFPGKYTTYSNLGTFYMLKGDLDGAINCLHKALAINPNAHFGREEYQLDLAEYLQKAKADPSVLDHSFVYAIVNPPQAATEPATDLSDVGSLEVEEFERDRNYGNPGRFESAGLKPNIFEGVVGMLRFGTDQSPDLYFALGDLLAIHGDKNLAVRAYQRVLDLNYSHAEAVRTAMDQVQEMEVPRGGLDPAVISAERADAAKWVAAYQKFEDDLVRRGGNTEAEASYAPFYAIYGRALKTNDVFPRDYLNGNVVQKMPVATAIVVVLIALGVILILRFARRLVGSKSIGPRA
jgi:tetratricopeptide (TPR) repeat protein